MEKLRVFEAFAGYGSQSMALERLGIDFEVVGISEIDKYAIQAYNAVHGETKNYGDISKIDWKEVPDFDLFTYSFPCQDISNAGVQRGLEEGSGTRSSLLWECKKTIEAKKPKYLLMENVKALTSQKFKPYLKKWTAYLESLGYTCYTRVLNSKDYGVPQNRDRCFMVSILGDNSFFFPEGFELEIRLKDILEKNVDEKYYLSKRVIDTFYKRNEMNEKKGNGFRFTPTHGEGIAHSILTTAGSRPDDNYVYGNKRVQSLVESGKIDGDHVQFLDAYNNVYEGVENNSNNPDSKDEGCSQSYRIRKLTPRECFRLMGVLDSDIDKIEAAGISKTQCYKLAGNSIVVDVLYHIFRKLFVEKECESIQLSLF